VPTSPRLSFQHAGDAVHTRGLDGFVKRHRRQDGWNALGQHGLAGARRTNEQDVVPTSAGYLQGALGSLLAVHVAHIDGVLGRFG
jgi:hypothetical protein